MRRYLTLALVFYASMAALVVLLGGLLYWLRERSLDAVAESSEMERDAASDRVRARVETYLGQAAAAVQEVERTARGDACMTNRAATESCLFAIAAANPNLAEVTFTAADRTGFATDGAPIVAPEHSWQVSVFRASLETSSLCTRTTDPAGGRYVARERCRDPARVLIGAPAVERIEQDVADPAEHLTFRTPASRAVSGRPVWTDLSYAELDLAQPPDRRRVVVTVMKAIEDGSGRLAGVARVGLLAHQIDAEVAAIMVNPDPADPYRIFIADPAGRLITPISAGDPLAVSGDDLRIAPRQVPPMIAAAIADPALPRAAKSSGVAHARFDMAGRRYDVSYRPLANTQGWVVGVVGPADYYLASLRDTVRTMLWATLAVIVVVIAGGVLTLRAVRRGLVQIARETDRMHAFDFTASRPRAPFRDVDAVLASVEQAKTAMRAMGKYVPTDLVRTLYETNREPALGGTLTDVSLMFTDIRDFTTYAESLAPEVLARLLGRYFAAMTAAIHGTGGTVDKYIGDAVMAMWNAPRPQEDHASAACRAALACVAATRELFASPAWEGSRPLVTRFGIHHAPVMVGHFGAPDRFSFTAIGDGVNLAARLEGLNKLYGTTILVSDAVARDARGAFAFRRVDRVAVKGKVQGVEVYELVGSETLPASARTYERALDAYFARDFAGALALLDGSEVGDGPSAVLASRCRRFRQAPPPQSWDGTYVAHEK